MLGLVIAGEAVDAGFKAEFRVPGLAVGLEVFAERNNLFHGVPEVFWDVGGEAYQRTSVDQSRIGEQTIEKEGEERKGGGTYPVP